MQLELVRLSFMKRPHKTVGRSGLQQGKVFPKPPCLSYAAGSVLIQATEQSSDLSPLTLKG